MKKKNMLMIALSLCLVAIIAVGATLAYFTDTTETMTNVVTTGNVKIRLYDETVKDDPDLVGGQETYDTEDPSKQTGIAYTNIVPGDTISKEVSVAKIEDSQDCYVAIRVDVADPLEFPGNTTALDLNHKQTIMELIKTAAASNGWVCQPIGTDDVSAVFYKTTALVRVDAKEDLFTTIDIPGAEWGNEVANASFVINVKAAAVQEANLEAPALDKGLANTALQQLLKNLDVTYEDTSVMPAPEQTQP